MQFRSICLGLHSPTLSPALEAGSGPRQRNCGERESVFRTYGGARIARLSWATVPRPFRAESLLAVRVSVTPCVQRECGTRSVS